MKIYIEERSETAETKLRSAFHNRAQTFEIRARGGSAGVHVIPNQRSLKDRTAVLWHSFIVYGKYRSVSTMGDQQRRCGRNAHRARSNRLGHARFLEVRIR